LEINVRKILAANLLSCGAVVASTAFAAPMGFKGSYMSMADVSPRWREGLVNYALTSRDAIGAEVVAMRSDDGRLTRSAQTLNYTRLAKRWNMPEAQANVWLFAGMGTVSGNSFDGQRTLWTPGVQVDYETTRVYVATTTRWVRATDVRHDYASLRAGFSFFEADYDEVQPWLIVEARRMRGLSAKTEITPMLRLIHQRYFVEAGVSNERQARVNVMFNF
jgi:hypothetical protein